jgi:hypothetical protein
MLPLHEKNDSDDQDGNGCHAESQTGPNGVQDEIDRLQTLFQVIASL